MLNSCNIQTYLCSSLNGPSKRCYSKHFRVWIIQKFRVTTVFLMTTIKGNLESIKISIDSVTSEKTITLCVLEWWTVTVKSVFIHNCSICKNSIIENTHSHVSTKVKEILAINLNLCETTVRSTRRSNRLNYWSLIIKVLDWWRPHIGFQSDFQINPAWFYACWSNALNFAIWSKFTLNNVVIEATQNLPSFLKVGPRNSNNIASIEWTHSRINIKKHRRLIVIEDIFILSVLYSIKSYFDTRLMIVITWGRYAPCSSRVCYCCSYSNFKINESAPSINGIIDLV